MNARAIDRVGRFQGVAGHATAGGASIGERGHAGDSGRYALAPAGLQSSGSTPARDATLANRTRVAEPTLFAIGALLFATAVACGDDRAADSASTAGTDASNVLVSPLETTGKLEFYVEATGAQQGKFPGESTRKGRESAAPAFRFHSGFNTPVASGSGQAVGKLQCQPVVFTKAWGKASTAYLQALANNERLTTVKLTFVAAANATGVVSNFQTITLDDVRVIGDDRAVAELDPAAGASSSALLEELTLIFQKMTVQNVQDGRTTLIDCAGRATTALTTGPTDTTNTPIVVTPAPAQ